jgi:hypothetical protein
MNKKYPYNMYKNTFNRTKDVAKNAKVIISEEEYESTRMNKQEWNSLSAAAQDYALTILEEEQLGIKG